MNRRLKLIPVVCGLAIAGAMFGAGDPKEPAFTDDFDLERCRIFLPHGGNSLFSLNPGRFSRYEGDDDGEFVELEITVTRRIYPIIFEENGHWLLALTRVIEEREWADGELVEISRNYFGRCARTGDVFYFGEEVDIYEDGVIVSHDGAWEAGVDGARPGLIMPERFLLGSRYFQEVAPGSALDQAEHVASGLTVTTDAGVFHDCVKIVETTPLEPGHESVKIYAPRVGLIVDDVLELVEFHR